MIFIVDIDFRSEETHILRWQKYFNDIDTTKTIIILKVKVIHTVL